MNAAAITLHKDNPRGWYLAEDGRPFAFYGSKAAAEKALAIFQKMRGSDSHTGWKGE